MNAVLFIPLASNVFEEILSKATTAIGQSVSNHLSLTATAMGFAACFVIFRLIQTVNDIEADDNAGGLGHVKLWDIIRPLVFFMLVSASPSVIGLIDSATSTVTAGINVSAGAIADSNTPFDRYIQSKWDSFTSSAEKFGDSFKESGSSAGSLFGPIGGAVSTARNVVSEENFNNVFTMIDSLWAIICNGWPIAIAWIVKQIMLLARAVYLILSKIMISLIKLFAPFMLALSILEPWKNNYQKLIANLLYFELWAPILSILTVICNSLLSVISSSYTIVSSRSSTGEFVRTISGDPTYTEMFAYIIVTLACLAIILQTPAIANTVINMGSTHDAHDNQAASKMLGRIPGVGKIV